MLVLARSVFVVLLLASLLPLGSAPQPPPFVQDAQRGPQAALLKLPTPGPEHQVLRDYAGKWSAHVKYYFGASTPLVQSTGVETNLLACQNLWVKTAFASDKNSPYYEGHGLLGFDPNRKVYVGAWADMVNPQLTIFEGVADEEARTLTLVGDVPDFRNASAMAKVRIVTIFEPDKNARKTTHYVQGADGKEIVFMTVDYVRTKGD